MVNNIKIFINEEAHNILQDDKDATKSVNTFSDSIYHMFQSQNELLDFITNTLSPADLPIGVRERRRELIKKYSK